MLFERIHPAPISVPTGSRDALFYMFRCMRISALKTPSKYRGLYYVWRFVAFSYGFIYLPLSFLLNYTLNFDKFTAGEFLTSLQLCFNCWCFSIKYFTILVHYKSLDRARDVLDNIDKYCETSDEYHKIRDAAAFGNKTYLTYGLVYFAYATSCLIDGLLNGRPPYNCYYPYIDWRASTLQLYVQAFTEYFTVGYAIFTAITTDSYPVLLIGPLRTHVDILKNRIERLGTGIHENNVKQRHNDLVGCIKVHKLMLEYCDTIRPPVSITIFAQFLICGSILGITIINLMVFSDLSSRFGIIAYIMAVLLQTFPLCYYCTGLIDSCDELADAIFHSGWMAENQSYKKMVLQFLQKLQQPMIFTALDIFTINLSTNINVAKFAFTVYAIAQGMNLEERFKKNE